MCVQSVLKLVVVAHACMRPSSPASAVSAVPLRHVQPHARDLFSGISRELTTHQETAFHGHVGRRSLAELTGLVTGFSPSVENRVKEGLVLPRVHQEGPHVDAGPMGLFLTWPW